MNNTDPQHLLQNVIEELKSEQFLGGAWLPISQAQITPAATPAQRKDAPMPSATTSANTKDKQNQLDQIAHTVAQCTRCTLHETRTKPVPGDGNPDARIVFVGEAPGQSEDEQGKPFVGRAGKLLTSIIEAMGLQRQDVFICNILKSRPPGNRDPRPEEIVACMDYLFEQLQIINPEIIVALGAHAAKTLLNTNEAIGRLRGRFHAYQPGPDAEPIKLMATYHPAYLLRNYSQENRQRVWEDMQMVLSELNLPIPRKK